MLSDNLANTSRRTVGVWDVPRVFFAPRALFERVEDIGAYGWAFVWLLTLVTVIGYATIETGLIDRQIDLGIQERLEEIEREYFDVVERSQRRKLIEDEIKKGDFERLMKRVSVVVAEPIKVLAGVLLIAAMLFGVVAMTGRKAEWHTLLTLCIYASYIDCLRLLFRLILMLRYETLEVDTSLAVALRPLMPGAENAQNLEHLSNVLTGIEPFAVWFWLIVIVGLSATRQLCGWRAWLTCSLFWMAAAGARMGIAFALAD